MLHCSASLWSADLANLASEIARVEPFVERFHLDVADGVYVPSLLFFPDLVRAVRRQTEKPLEVHLMVTQPERWVAPFADSGATDFLFCFDSTADLAGLVSLARRQGARHVGVSLRIDEPLDSLENHWDLLDQLTIFGTEVGIKGAEMAPEIPSKVAQARLLVARLGLNIEIQVDGGIRRHTVPLLAQAGADSIVPGSLLFEGDPAETRRWLDGLETP